MQKCEIERQRLEQYVLVPDGVTASFKTWWKGLENEDGVTVKYPHERHGLAGKISNHAKTSILQVCIHVARVHKNRRLE